MYKIRTFNKIAKSGLERFPRDRFEVSSEFQNPDAILLRSQQLSGEHLTSRLRAMARAGAGVNNVPVGLCTEAGVVVFNTPGANANSVKELVVAALLLSSRDVLGGVQYVETLREVTDERELNAMVEAEKNRFKGEEVHGKTLGVVGLGAIGSSVAQAGLALGMKVLGYDPSISVEAAWRLPSDVERMDNLHSLASRSDFVTLHVPLNDATRNLISREALRSFKQGAVLLNFARQEIIDEAALTEALESGPIGGYFSDFPSPFLRGRDDVHATPHLGASTRQAEENCAVMAAEQLVDFLDNGNIKNSVNFPDVHLERTPGYRLAITNVNVPRVLGQVLSLLANHDINIIDMINKSQENVAYNLIDLESPPSDALLAEIDALAPVMNVRVFSESEPDG